MKRNELLELKAQAVDHERQCYNRFYGGLTMRQLIAYQKTKKIPKAAKHQFNHADWLAAREATSILRKRSQLQLQSLHAAT